MRGGKRAEDRRDERERERERDHVRMCDVREREMERMLEAIFRWRGESGAWAAVGEGRERKKV